MNRRRALAIAGTVTATAAGAVLAFSANVGLLGFSRADTSALGTLQADQLVTADQAKTAAGPTTTLAPEVVVQYDDVIVRDPAPAGAAPGTEAGDDDGADEHGTTTTTAGESTTSTTAVRADDHETGDHEEEPLEIVHDGERDDD